MTHRRVAVVLVVAMVGVLGLSGQAYAATEAVSPNWAGAVIAGNTFDGAHASFIVPNTVCSKPGSQIAIWAGVDGGASYNQNELLQVGIRRNCTRGNQGPWTGIWSVDPSHLGNTLPQSTFSANSGDLMYEFVQDQHGGKVAFELYDQTRQEQVVFTEPYAGLQGDDSAECIVEDPILAKTGREGSLSKFAPIVFSQCVGTALTGHGTTDACNISQESACVPGSSVVINSMATKRFERAAASDPLPSSPNMTLTWMHA